VVLLFRSGRSRRFPGFPTLPSVFSPGVYFPVHLRKERGLFPAPFISWPVRTKTPCQCFSNDPPTPPPPPPPPPHPPPPPPTPQPVFCLKDRASSCPRAVLIFFGMGEFEITGVTLRSAFLLDTGSLSIGQSFLFFPLFGLSPSRHSLDKSYADLLVTLPLVVPPLFEPGLAVFFSIPPVCLCRFWSFKK